MEEDILAEKDRLIKELRAEKSAYFNQSIPIKILGVILLVLFAVPTMIVSENIEEEGAGSPAAFIGVMAVAWLATTAVIQWALQRRMNRSFDKRIEIARIERARIARQINED